MDFKALVCKLVGFIRSIEIRPLGNMTLPGKIVIPFLLFFACFLAFGLLLSPLGYFQDDWHHVYYAYHEGIDGLQRFFFTDSRPFAFFIYKVFFSVLGFDPSYWHWGVMLLRFSTSFVFWLMLYQLWPDQNDLTGLLALFFALHPVFTLQPLSVAYTIHWISYLSVALSFCLMVFANRTPRWFWQITILAVIFQVFHLLMMEYYTGLEIFRLLIIWLALPIYSFGGKIKKVFIVWLPYLLVLLLYVPYRLSFSILFGYDRFESPFLFWLESPSNSFISLIETTIKDTIFIVISPWYTAIMPNVFDLTRPSTWGMIGGVIVFGVIYYFCISSIGKNSKQTSDLSAYTNRLVIFGFLGFIFSLIPFWLTDFKITAMNPLWSSRFALPALLGASMITVGVVFFFIQERSRRILFLSILLSISFGFHIQVARNFKASSDKQTQFYWQLYWRAPVLASGTLIVADEEVLPYMGDTPTAYAINLLYPKVFPASQADYWFSPGSKDIPHLFTSSEISEMKKYSSTFFASPKQVIAVTFNPEEGQCLWFLRPEYADVRFFSAEAYRWMQYSNVSFAQSDSNYKPPSDIFGDEPAHTWCYFYQKADLAEQQGDWNEVIRLWTEAQKKKLRPSNSVEMLPFIKAYAQLSELEQAQKMTLQANTLPPRMRSLLCTMWTSFNEFAEDDTSQEIVNETKEDLGCQK